MSQAQTVPPFPLLEIVSFVDAETAVVVGPHSEDIKEGDDLYILGIGFSIIPQANVPLIAPKARVQATFAAGPYVLVKSPAKEVTLDLMQKSFLGVSSSYFTRDKLSNAEQSFLGDPGREPIKIGDTVVRVKDLAAYIKYRASSTKPA